MKILKPDFQHRIQIEGVDTPCMRPVDIDPSKTGFRNLRTMRIYRFEAGTVVDGHAEQDEVLIVLLSGTIELTLEGNGDSVGPVCLQGASKAGSANCAAYLPPEGAYRMLVRERADVAYVRAALEHGPAPCIFPQADVEASDDASVLVEESTYAEKLRLRVVRLDATRNPIEFAPVAESESALDALLHLNLLSADGAISIREEQAEEQAVETPVVAYDTIALSAGSRPALRLEKGTVALATLVLA